MKLYVILPMGKAWALIDSGATNTFMNPRFKEDRQIPTKTLPQVILVWVVSEMVDFSVAHKYIRIAMSMINGRVFSDFRSWSLIKPFQQMPIDTRKASLGGRCCGSNSKDPIVPNFAEKILLRCEVAQYHFLGRFEVGDGTE